MRASEVVLALFSALDKRLPTSTLGIWLESWHCTGEQDVKYGEG